MNSTLSLKRQAQSLFKGLGIYERVKASRIYDLYWSYADPHWVTDRAKEVQFYKSVLRGLQKRDMIFDIGANDGRKTDVFLRLGARVIAVEPDESNLDVLKGKFVRNRIFPKAVRIEGKAVSDRTGKMSMFIEAPGSALNTLSPKWADSLRKDETRFKQHFEFATEKTVETTTVENLIGKHGVPFYIKIDVEGYELNVLQGLKRAVPYLSFEVNLPEFKEEGMKCIQLLHEISPESEFNCVADCLQGLKFADWMHYGDFAWAFDSFHESVVEIFWRTK